MYDIGPFQVKELKRRDPPRVLDLKPQDSVSSLGVVNPWLYGLVVSLALSPLRSNRA